MGSSSQLFPVALLDSGKMKKKKKSLLTKWKNLDLLTCKFNLQHEPWLSGCLLHRKYGNTLKLIVFINNIGPESIIVINLVSKAITIMLERMADFEHGEKENDYEINILSCSVVDGKEKGLSVSSIFLFAKRNTLRI